MYSAVANNRSLIVSGYRNKQMTLVKLHHFQWRRYQTVLQFPRDIGAEDPTWYQKQYLTCALGPCRTGNVCCGSVSHSSYCFVLMVASRYRVVLLRPWTCCQEDTKQASDGFIMIWGIFMLHGLNLLHGLNMSLASDCYIALLHDHLHSFINFMYPNNVLFLQNNEPWHWAKVTQNWFEEHSDKWCSQHVHLTWVQSSIHGTW